MQEDFLSEISKINEEIAKRGDIYELYYERGYLYFLANDDVKAKEDYKKAISIGLDPTELPYYTFSNSNSKRREFLLPEKIMVFLLLIMIIGAMLLQFGHILVKIKNFF